MAQQQQGAVSNMAWMQWQWQAALCCLAMSGAQPEKAWAPCHGGGSAVAVLPRARGLGSAVLAVLAVQVPLDLECCCVAQQLASRVMQGPEGAVLSQGTRALVNQLLEGHRPFTRWSWGWFWGRGGVGRGWHGDGQSDDSSV